MHKYFCLPHARVAYGNVDDVSDSGIESNVSEGGLGERQLARDISCWMWMQESNPLLLTTETRLTSLCGSHSH